MSARRRDRRGVTLVEMIVSLVILGMLSMIGYSAFTYLIQDREDVETASVEVERAANVYDLIHTWLVAATITTQVTGQVGSTNATIYNADGTVALNPAAPTGDVLSFTTTADNPAFAPNAMMKLFIDDDDNTPETGLTLEYRVNAQTPLGRIQLDPTIVYLTVEFLDNRTNQWYAAADAAAIQPKAVRVIMGGSENVYTSGILSLPIIQAIPITTAAAPAGAGL